MKKMKQTFDEMRGSNDKDAGQPQEQLMSSDESDQDSGDEQNSEEERRLRKQLEEIERKKLIKKEKAK